MNQTEFVTSLMYEARDINDTVAELEDEEQLQAFFARQLRRQAPHLDEDQAQAMTLRWRALPVWGYGGFWQVRTTLEHAERLVAAHTPMDDLDEVSIPHRCFLLDVPKGLIQHPIVRVDHVMIWQSNHDGPTCFVFNAELGAMEALFELRRVLRSERDPSAVRLARFIAGACAVATVARKEPWNESTFIPAKVDERGCPQTRVMLLEGV